MTRVQWAIGIGTGIALAVTAAMNAARGTTIDTTDNGYPAPVVEAYPAPYVQGDTTCYTFEGFDGCFPHVTAEPNPTAVVLPTPTSAPTFTPEP